MKKPTKHTGSQIKRGLKAQAALHQYNALREAGTSAMDAADQVGFSLSTIMRWREAYGAPGGHFHALIPGVSKGRKSVAKRFREVLGESGAQAVFNQVTGNNLDTKSNTLAWRVFPKFGFNNGQPAPAEVVAEICKEKASKQHIARSLLAETKFSEQHTN